MLYKEPTVLNGAGSAGDCLTLIDRLEGFLDETSNNLLRACVALAKAWRTEKYMRNLEAQLCVADATTRYNIMPTSCGVCELTHTSLMVSGNGDVIEPEDGVMSAGMPYQLRSTQLHALILQDLAHCTHFLLQRH